MRVLPGGTVEAGNFSRREMKTLTIAIVLAALSALCPAQEITVAAASDLQFAMQALATRFQKESGKTVKVSYGSSGNLYKLQQNGRALHMLSYTHQDSARTGIKTEMPEPSRKHT